MVHLNNLPFQWREAPKKSICSKKQSSTRLFVTLSKQKLYAKKALNRFRHKTNPVLESSSSGFAQRMMNSLSGAQCGSPFNRDSSICISKRASFFRSYGLSQRSEILDKDMLFQDALAQGPSGDKPSLHSNLTENSSNLSTFLGKRIIVSYSSTERPVRCRCDFYDDLQRKWEHVKKSVAEIPGVKNPFSLLKNFCSSLFGPSCNVDTCPNKLEKRGSLEKKAKKPDESEETEETEESCSNTMSAECQVSNQRDAETHMSDKEIDDILRDAEKPRKRNFNKGFQITIEPGQPGKRKGVPPKKPDAAVQSDEKADEAENTKGVGSHVCLCDEAVQITQQHLCTCATQYTVGGIKISNMKFRERAVAIHEVTTVSPIANKKTQHKGAEMADKATHCTARKHYKKGKEVKSGVSRMNQKLSLESNLLCPDSNEAQLKDDFTDCSTTDTSSSSLRSDGSKTDTTICSLATLTYDTPRRRKYRVKVITKANQSTLTDTPRVCDTATETHDWWSPMVERKPNEEIVLEKKKGLNVIDKEVEKLKELKALKELKEATKRRKHFGMGTDGRNVTFRNSTQIIPPNLFPNKDIMSPSRYLLESQRYYNELYAYNYRPRPQLVYNYVSQMPKHEKTRSPLGGRRNHHRKMKRLDECYSPRRHLSPRKRKTESTRMTDSPRPRRKSTHRQSNTRHHSKNHSPRKRV